jgi:aminopeptidase N
MIARRRSFVSCALICLLAGALPAAARADGAGPRGALSRDVVPERYALTLHVDPRSDHFEGTVDITVRVAAPTRRLWLHGQGLQVRDARIRTGDRIVPLVWVEADTTTGVARLDAPEPVAAGAATLHLEWTAPYMPGAEGLSRVKVGDDAYVFTQMEPISARRAFPAFDDPQFKTPFEVAVLAPAADRVVANAPLAASEPAGEGLVRHRFAPTLPLPTYLLALAVGPLDIVEVPPVPPGSAARPPLPLRGVATRGQGAKLAFALEQAPAIVRVLEEYFGTPFPYPKLDLIASPGMGGAMENAGAIIFAEGLLLVDRQAPPSELKDFFEVTAHEVAHHWFGDLVTPRWWDDIWLNESFAEWMGIAVARRLRPDLVPATSVAHDALHAMASDARATGRPIRQPVTENGAIGSTFDAITYLKGASVLAMVESYLGADPFRRGVQAHLRLHAHATATADDFFATMAGTAAQPRVIDAFRSFVEQQGLPLVTARRGADSTVELAQARYVPVGGRASRASSWTIPLCATFYGARASGRRCALLGDAPARLTAPPEVGPVLAVLPNSDGAGYFRLALDDGNLRALLARAATLPDGEALVLADSVNGAFAAGEAKLATLLDAAAALAAHPNHQVATQLGSDLLTIAERMVPQAQQPVLRAHLGAIYLPRLDALGGKLDAAATAGDPPDRQLLRRKLVLLVALGARDPALRGRLVAAATAALADPRALDLGLRDCAWAVAVQERAAPVLDAVHRALTGTDALARDHAAFALGWSDEPRASAARALALDPAVATAEVYGLLAPQFARSATREAAWTWLQANFDALSRRIPDYARSGLFRFAEGFCTDAARAQVQAFGARKVRESGRGELELGRALESIGLCTALRAAHQDDLGALPPRP